MMNFGSATKFVDNASKLLARNCSDERNFIRDKVVDDPFADIHGFTHIRD